MKTLSYASKCGRLFEIVKTHSSIVVYTPLEGGSPVGIFMLPWYFTDGMVREMIEFWDTTYYNKIDWKKVRSDLDAENEV